LIPSAKTIYKYSYVYRFLGLGPGYFGEPSFTYQKDFVLTLEQSIGKRLSSVFFFIKNKYK
jgi:hypothetical protein